MREDNNPVVSDLNIALLTDQYPAELWLSVIKPSRHIQCLVSLLMLPGMRLGRDSIKYSLQGSKLWGWNWSLTAKGLGLQLDMEG